VQQLVFSSHLTKEVTLAKKLKSKTDDLIDQLSDKIDEARQTMTNLKDKAAGTAENMKSKVKDAMEDEADMASRRTRTANAHTN